MPGPTPSLQLEQIVDTAVAVADRNGLDALSMRKVGAELGVAAMALYRYVKTKDELIDLMIERVLRDPPTDRDGIGWRAAMVDDADRLRQTALAHPWTVSLLLGRPAFGRNAMAHAEASLRALDGLGLSIDQMLDVVSTVQAFTVGFVQSELADAEAQRRTGLNEAEWRQSIAPLVREVIASGDIPLVERVVIEAEDFPDPDTTFARRVGHILDGFEVAVAAAAPAPRSRARRPTK